MIYLHGFKSIGSLLLSFKTTVVSFGSVPLPTIYCRLLLPIRHQNIDLSIRAFYPTITFQERIFTQKTHRLKIDLYGLRYHTRLELE
jgi:hypothetical protein